MPKFRQTTEILKLMSKKENIRNIGIIAHIDHGKTTMTDSLLAKAGLLSPTMAGKARALDYLEEEQKRGITIKTANISLLHETNSQSYIINLVDTPGHVDFTGKVTRALRAIDGAIVVVDAVEEIMAQTETVTRQALEERVKPVLFINKVDRLITELKLNPEEIQNKFTRIIRNFNNLIDIHAEPEFKSKWKVDPEKETVVFGSALHKWGFTLKIAREKDIKFSDIIDAYAKDEYREIAKLLPLSNAILDMMVKNAPSPIEAQKYRLPKIWKGNINSKIGRAMQNCDDNGPTVMCITNAQTDPRDGLIAAGRLFSGSIKKGDLVYLMDSKKEHCVQQVSVYMGAFRENADQITAGNIAALSGTELARAGETLVDVKHKNAMVSFEHAKYVSEPVITIAVEPKNPQELPRLIDAMSRLSIENPNLVTAVDKETGQCLISGMGELHLDIALKLLTQYSGKIALIPSNPIVTYRESILKQSSPVTAKTSDKRNLFCLQIEPLEIRIVDLMDNGELTEDGGQEEMSKILHEKADYSPKETEKILALDKHRNMLIDSTKNNQSIQENKESIISGFHWACSTGPLCEQPIRGIKTKLLDAQIQTEPTQSEPVQIMRAVSRAILGAMLTANPVLLEPIYRIEVSTPTRLFGACSNIITRKRGKIATSIHKDGLTMITGYIPVAETFGLHEEMRSATSGYAFWQCTFDSWEKMPENIAVEVTKQTRRRKGLSQEIPKPEKFIEEN